jgi:hypothetical protein
MARALPHIRQHSPKHDSSQQAAPKKRIHRSSSIEMNPRKVRLNKMVEARLAKQFQYFRAEFLEHALGIGIPVPLDMVEEKNGKVMPFVNQKGPRYLLNIIHAYPESVHLLRSSLSFLIVIIAILTRKINESSDTDRRLNVTTHNVQMWATEALNNIADSSSVAICTNLLRHSHSEAIQELILNLLAQLVNASSEAAIQMMHRPNVHAAASTNTTRPTNLDNSNGNSNPATPRESATPATAVNRTNDPDDMTCLSYMFSVVSHNRNRYTVMTSCAEVCLALLKDKSRDVSETIARSWISQLSLKPGEVESKIRYSVGENKSDKSKPKKDKSKGKPLSVLTRKPPTTALARGASKVNLMDSKQLPQQAPPKSTRVSEELNDNPNEWAALKVLLKFLHRFMRYGAGGGDKNSLAPEKGFGNDDESLSIGSAKGRARFHDSSALENEDIVPHKHKKALYTAHSRVLLVVCELVNNSPAVAKFILSMPGACSILKASCEMHKSTDIGGMVMNCLYKLQGETEVMFKKALTTHHSMSFELTHGKSAKLFNPVSPISRRESAMLSPERVRNLEGQAPSTFTVSCGSDMGDLYTRPKSRGNTSNFVLSTKEENVSRPSSRAGLIPVSKLFSTEEKKYQDAEEEKRRHEHEQKMMNSNFLNEEDEDEDDCDEDVDLQNDSWFLNSFEQSDEMKKATKKTMKKTRRSRPPEILTSFDGDPEAGSRPASTQRPASSARQRSPVPPYNPPESPTRRGLGPHNGGLKGQKDPSESLHRSLFTNLPEMPNMPIRLEAETIISDCNAQHKENLLCRSMSMTSSVVDTAYREGFYRDGKNNIPISERARRVYVPDMLPFQGDADRHPNLMTEEYLEEQRNRPKSQGSVLNERSARLRATTRRKAARDAQLQSAPTTPAGNQENFKDAFSDYYEGLLPLNGVGEVEPESQFQLFLVKKQEDVGVRARTAPSAVGSRRRGGGQSIGRVDGDDSMQFEESTQFEEHSSIQGHASYASSLSKDENDEVIELQEDSQCGDSLIVDWNQDHDVVVRPPERENYTSQIVQSVDILFP